VLYRRDDVHGPRQHRAFLPHSGGARCLVAASLLISLA
jgi:hypothetical protein